MEVELAQAAQEGQEHKETSGKVEPMLKKCGHRIVYMLQELVKQAFTQGGEEITVITEYALTCMRTLIRQCCNTHIPQRTGDYTHA